MTIVHENAGVSHDRHLFADLQLRNCLVDAFKVRAYQVKHYASVLRTTRNAYANRPILNVRLHKCAMAFPLQDHAAAPIGIVRDEPVHADNEAGDHASPPYS